MKRKPELSEFSPAQLQEVAEMSARGTKAVFDFCIPVKGADRGGGVLPFNARTLKLAMRRFVAVAWLLHSEMLVDDELDEQGIPTGRVVPLSLDQLGKLPQLDCTKVALSLLAKRFGEKFKFQSRVQKRQSTKPNYASAAVTGWEKRRAREAAATA